MLPEPRSRISLPRAYLTGFPSPFGRLASYRGFRQKQPPEAPQEVGAHHPELLLRQLEKVDRIVQLVPERCGTCDGLRLRGSKEEPRRHQQVELPRPKAEVTEYQCHSVDCLDCGAVTEAQLPPEAVPVFGERLAALACALVGQYRLSKRNSQRFFADVLGVDLSLGMLPKLSAEMADALAAPAVEAEAHVQEQDFATSFVVVFRIAFSRGSEVAMEVLGDRFIGFLGTDRLSGYNRYDLGLRQVCWSHLPRDFQGFIDRGGVGADFGRELMALRHKMFRWWHRVRDGTMERTSSGVE